MGDVIRRNAAAEDIIKDVRTTYERAQAKGGIWKALADARLGPVILMIDAAERRHAQAKTNLATARAQLDAADERADRFLGRKGDELWNLVDRPRNDPALALILPGGIGYYTEGPDDEQPDRMELLAELLEADLHPKLDPQVARTLAGEVRSEAAALRVHTDAYVQARTREELCGRVRLAVARAAHMELAALKRSYKAEGLSESEIHTVIPDRGRPGGKDET